MGTITGALRAAQSGLLTTQAAVDAAARNIANANTEGYSRKIINFENRVLAGHGAGVQLSEFTRSIDEGLLKDLRRELSETSLLDKQVTYFTRIQNMFGSPGDNTSLSHVVNQFHQAVESLALSPDKTLEQSEFVRFAQEIGLKLQSMTEEIQALRLQADKEIEEAVNRINALTGKIAETSDKIIRNEAISNDVTDLLDIRDQALKDLSSLVEITTFPRNDGDLVVFTTDGFPLVDRTANIVTHAAVGNLTTTSTFAAGNINGIFVGGSGEDDEITNRITGGELAALIAQRDDVLPNLQSQLDELASEVRDLVNSIHNRGTPVPGLQSMSGNRRFIDAETQTITLDPTNSSNDVSILLFDSSGEQLDTTTLNTIMVSGSYGTGTQANFGPWSITEVAATVEDWLQANGAGSATVSVDPETYKLNIELNNISVYLAFRDETATADGSAPADAEIGFDSDGDGDVDEIIFGFSNFFKLNDLYADSSNGNLYDSEQLSSSFTSSAATLTFYDSAGGVGNGNEIGTVSIDAMASLSEIAEAINDENFGVKAAIIPDGSGFRLRLLNDDAREMIITQGPSDTLLNDIGLKQSTARAAATLHVRDDIQETPGLAAVAQAQYDITRGRYIVNAGNNTVIQQMADALSTKQAFDSVGGLIGSDKTIEEFSIDILARQANLADINKSQLDAQISLTQALELESEGISGVNIDEEMSNLIVFQQSFSASARVISVIQRMFEALENAV